MQAIVAAARLRSFHVKRMIAKRVLHAGQLRYGIRLVGGHDARYAFDAAQHIDLLIGHAQRGHHAKIAQLGCVIILVPCQAHIGTGHAQAGIEAATERRHHGDGQEPSPRMRDGAQDFFTKRSHGYHSKSAALPGWGLMKQLATRPSRTWMTRSAISANAELWVMRTTVLPVLRHVSCSNFKMALPVL